MLRVSCIIFIHPAFAVKLHGKILLPIFLCGLVAVVDFDKEEEEISLFLISSCEVVSSLALLIRSSLATYTLSNALEAITNFFFDQREANLK